MITPECTWGVTRQGEFQPCDKPAVARVYDPESAEVWSVCAYHTRKDALPTEVWLAAEVRRAKAEALREAAAALETATVHWSNDGEDTRAAWLRRRANRLEEAP